ncbi:unnamed protein product, partial [Choristocarpus tenellus]
SNFLSHATFWWINPLVSLAYARPLEPENLWEAPKSSDTDRLVKRFEEAWGAQLSKPAGSRSLSKALASVFRAEIVFTGAMAFLQQGILLLIPLIVQQLLQWFLDEDEPASTGFILASILYVPTITRYCDQLFDL